MLRRLIFFFAFLVGSSSTNVASALAGSINNHRIHHREALSSWPTQQLVARGSPLQHNFSSPLSRLWTASSLGTYGEPFSLSCPVELSRKTFFPRRIISLSLASDEIIFEMMKRTGTLSRLSAVSSVAADERYSFIAADIKAQGIAFSGAHIEGVMAKKADWVVAASFNNPEFLAALSRASVPYVVLHRFEALKDIITHIKALGELLDAPEVAHELAGELRAWQPFARNHEQVLYYDSSSGYVAGRNTLIHDLIERSGFHSPHDREGWWRASPEYLLSLSPDYILAPCTEPSEVLESLRSTVPLMRMRATRQGRVLCVPYKALHSTSFYVMEAYKALRASYESGS